MRRLLVAAALVAVPMLGSCGGAPGEPAADGLLAPRRLFEEAARTSDPSARRALLDRCRDRIEPLCKDRREARWFWLEAEERLGDLDESEGRSDEAGRRRAARLDRARSWLAADPGDGTLRGILGYGLLMAGGGEEGWKVILEGGEACDPDPAALRGLYLRAIVFPAWRRAQGDEEGEKASSAGLIVLIRGIRERLRGPAGAKDAVRVRFEEELLGQEGRLLVRLARFAEAETAASALESADPANLEAWKLRQIIQASRQESR